MRTKKPAPSLPFEDKDNSGLYSILSKTILPLQYMFLPIHTAHIPFARICVDPQYLPRTPCGISHCREKGKTSGDCYAVQSHGTLTPAPSLWPGRELRKYHYPLRVSLPTKEQPCLSCGISACPTCGVMAYRRRARPTGNVPDILCIQFSGGGHPR